MSPATRQPTAQYEADGFQLREIRYPAALRQARHHHERTTATLVFGGSLEETVGSKREEAGPLSVVFKPAGTEHANRMGTDGATTLQLGLNENFFVDPGEVPAESEWAWSRGGAPARRFLALYAGWRSGEESGAVLESRVLDLLAALRGRPVMRSGAPAWLSCVVEEVEDTFRSPRRVRDMAADASVHPVALARAHRRHFGCSISDRIRRRRVEAAADLLGRGIPPAEVAYRTGFSDQSHLTRVFGAETGLTPGRYRRLRADGDGPVRPWRHGD
ncbi:MAG: AraC family transcriptional regulator [Gemmatimonadota bacterium]|nr:AraC family transcriptional regulator [Gemmatimonadota bacterium]